MFNRVVVIGDALIDEIHDDAGVRELVGGAALNVAVGVTRLGVSATLIAMVGADAAGDQIREYVREHGVQLIESAAPLGSSRAVVSRDAQGEPSYSFNEAAQGRSIHYSDEAKAALDAADVIAVSCFPFDREAEVVALADAVAGRRLVIDPNPRTGMMRDKDAFVDGFERIAADAAAIKVGSDDASVLYDGDLAALAGRLRAQGAEIVLMTAGSEGATLLTPEGEISKGISQLPGSVVDTVGAGDATLAALVVGLVDGAPVTEDERREVLQKTMDVAAATVRGEGGLLRTPGPISPTPFRQV